MPVDSTYFIPIKMCSPESLTKETILMDVQIRCKSAVDAMLMVYCVMYVNAVSMRGERQRGLNPEHIIQSKQ